MWHFFIKIIDRSDTINLVTVTASSTTDLRRRKLFRSDKVSFSGVPDLGHFFPRRVTKRRERRLFWGKGGSPTPSCAPDFRIDWDKVGLRLWENRGACWLLFTWNKKNYTAKAPIVFQKENVIWGKRLLILLLRGIGKALTHFRWDHSKTTLGDSWKGTNH